MDRVPDPLRAGSPTAYRRESLQDQLPSPLQVGSPVVERSSAAFSQNRTSLSRSSQDRLSQLFPARTASISSPSAVATSSRDSLRRLSFPSPLVPAAEPAYKVPLPPAPPSFSESTAYEPRADPFDTHHASIPRKPSRSKSILSRLTSLHSSTRQSSYGRIEEDDGELGHHRGRSGSQDLGHGNTDVGGPIALRSMASQRRKGEAEDGDEELDPTVAGYAAEFHRLEAGDKPGLGGGMVSIVESPFVYTSPQPQISHKRGLSNTNAPVREDAQAQAEKRGEILVVTEAPVDIGNFDGGHIDTGVPLNSNVGSQESEANRSYYFPEDPEQPSWRPLSMHWAYISLLSSIAFALAGVQEYLCQLSIKKAAEGSGLLEFMAPNELSMAAYFSWKYAPTLILVSYGILWQISDFEVKRLEPYYQLSKRTGATAAESINNDYLTFLAYLIPLKSSRYKQWAVTLSSMSYLIAGSLVPVLQSASVNMYPEKEDRKPDELKFVRIDPRWSRAVSACLLLVCLLGMVLIFQLRRKSGLLSDPKGIAGIAAMATRSHILNDFQGLDTAPQHKIHKQLRHRRYILHKSSLWQGEFIRNSTEEVKEHTDPRPLMLRRRSGIAYICFLLLVTIMIPIFMFADAANKVIEKLPWLLTALATIIKLLWGTMDCDIRLLEPFWILSQRRAPAKTLTLDYTGTIPGYLSIKAFFNGHYVVSIVGLGAIMTELLTVCVSSFSVDGKKFFPGRGHDDGPGGKDMANDLYNTDETFKSFWVSFTLVLSILVLLMLIASLVYWRRSHKFIPRQVGTIASVLAFIHQSKMLLSFVDTERMDSGQMTHYLEKIGNTYGLGWFTGRDGQDHCGIDEEPLHSEYKWGVDWREGRIARFDTLDYY